MLTVTVMQGYLLFTVKGCDLKTVPPVFAVHSHDGAVVDVHDQPPSHVPSRLPHQVPTLGEVKLSLPAGRHQPCLTKDKKKFAISSLGVHLGCIN